jgi:uncharacterized membrane protein YdbT with pleckstrin-like domain
MARGRPLAWGAGFGLVLGGSGLYALTAGGDVPGAVGYPLLALAAVAVVLGAYVSRVAPAELDVDPEATFEPSQLGAVLLAGASVPFLVATLYALYLTNLPYVYPTLAFVAFVVLFLKGSVRYWQNTLTTYYVTGDRVISEYRFLSVKRSSISHADITNVSRRQSAVETLTGLGSVRVTVAGSQLTFRDIGDPAEAERALNNASG